MNSVYIDNFKLEPFGRTFIIAELSANHNGSLDLALDSIRAAKRAGADAIKLQTYTADTLTLDVKAEDFMISKGTIWDGRYLHDLYKEAYTPWEWHPKLFRVASDEGLICFSSPFDKTAVDFLENLDTPAYKIASPEITDIPLIEYVASKNKPVIISTGVADDEDIELAISACHKQNNYQIVLLKCTSAYPARVDQANLIMIRDMAERFDVLTGLSDHTLGTIVPVTSVAFGSCVLEKHFILDKDQGGVDSSFSLDEAEFTRLCEEVRNAELAIGKIDYTLDQQARESRSFSRSLYVSENIKTGQVLTEDNIRSVRPGHGLAPRHYPEILGRTAKRNLEKGEALSWDMVEE